MRNTNFCACHRIRRHGQATAGRVSITTSPLTPGHHRHRARARPAAGALPDHRRRRGGTGAHLILAASAAGVQLPLSHNVEAVTGGTRTGLTVIGFAPAVAGYLPMAWWALRRLVH